MKKIEKYLIAEIGINHNGDFLTAKTLINEAAHAGADAIKFQYRNLGRAYNETSREIGDEALKVEIKKNFLSTENILLLLEYAKQLGLDVGISFFDFKDIEDFSSSILMFDFYKIPSVELTNMELINSLLKFDKIVFISTGAHSEEEIDNVFKRLTGDKWIPLHCISNYPTLSLNSKLGYINHLTKKWKRQAGYSSHDENWELCMVAFTLGATVIERHITLDKYGPGLDHSTSSTPNEFKKLSNFMNEYKLISQGDSDRLINQGELINRQNLGKSFFALTEVKAGEQVRINDYEYRHPRVGLSEAELKLFIGKKLLQNCKAGAPLTKSHFKKPKVLPDRIIQKCEQMKISLPVRLHDYYEIYQKIPISNFELHLSVNDVEFLEDFKPASIKHNFSIHLPDYQDSIKLLNPFSKNISEKLKAQQIINSIKSFAIKLSKIQEQKVILVGSFSQVDDQKVLFYQQCKDLQDEFESFDLLFSFQWLPPFAWYFGGSARLDVFNNLSDIELIKANNLNICLDTSHLLMGAKYYNFNPNVVLQSLISQITQFHISDAKGFDGEGFQIGKGDLTNLDFLKKILEFPHRKVIEVWQGHLNLFEGFVNEIEAIGSSRYVN
jgi:sialic acid synthase SpsE/sugar phosphate isomerase/epimerase